MSEGHHTPEQVDKAFAYAPKILRRLKEVGVTLPSFTLYDDASGTLNLGNKITPQQYELAIVLVHSKRLSMLSDDKIAIDFCCGLVTAAEKAA